jgi:hypothetical protein
MNRSASATLTVTGPIYVKAGPLSCGNLSISGGPLIVEGDVDIRVTGNGYVNITNCSAWPVAIAWKGGQLYFGGNSVSTFTNTIYSENGGSMDFKGTAFALSGGAILLRGKPANGGAPLNLNGTPDLSLAPMDADLIQQYFVSPGTPTTSTTFTVYAWQ